MMKKTVGLFALMFINVAVLNSPASALARYECKGITPDTIVLTPYEDGSVNLSFNKGPVEATSKFSHHGDVFAAEFKNFDGQDALYVVILDTLTRNGYEFVDLAGRPSGATKITCWWYQN